MSLTLRQLRYFMAVAETGKVSEAALQVSISASSITEAIKDLEYDLEVKLFERKRTGLTLTHEGYLFLQSAKKVFSAVDDAREIIKNRSREVSGPLKLSASITVSGYFLSTLLDRFIRAYPDIDLHLEERTRIETQRQMKLGQLDAGIVLVSNVPDSSDVEKLTLLRSQRRLWLSGKNPLIEKTIVSLEDLKNKPYIQLLIDESPNTTMEFWKGRDMGPNIFFSSASIEAVRNLVAKDLGVTILSDMVYRPWSLDGDRVETRPIHEDIPSLDTGIIWPKNTPISPQTKAFIDFCRMEYTSGIKKNIEN